MNTTKLTLSIPRPVLDNARRLSKRRRESISSMFTRFVEAAGRELPAEPDYPPKTLRALSLARGTRSVPTDLDWRAIRDERLAERFAP